MRKKLTRVERYPGIDNRFVICDVCGKKFRVKETTRITDRYNLENSMIVCFADADKVNPQIMPIYIQEDLLVRKDYVRPESTYFKYISPGTILPSAPTSLMVNLDQFLGAVLLTWNGPNNTGNSSVLGYRIYRCDDPVLGEFNVLVENTNSPATMFVDYSAEISGIYYIYVVSIITAIGESPKSNEAYWPVEEEINYLILPQNEDMLSCPQDNKIIVLRQI